MVKHTAHRISSGLYLYRGFGVRCVGYYNPEHKVCWEAFDDRGYGFAHSYSLKDTKFWIDKTIEEYETDYIPLSEEQINKLKQDNG